MTAHTHTRTQKLWLITAAIWAANVALNLVEHDWDAAANAFGATFLSLVIAFDLVHARRSP